LQENVGSARKEDVGIMSRALGVYPVRINSSLVTAQLRDRYYWSNIRTREDGMFGDIITDIPQPEDRGIMFGDILTSGSNVIPKDYLKEYRLGNLSTFERDKHTFLNTESGRNDTQEYLIKRDSKTNMITLIYEEDNELRCKANTIKGYDVVTENDCIDLSFPTSTTRRARVTKGKSPCLMESNNNLYSYKDGMVRTVNQVEMERLQGFPDGYTSMLSTRKAASLLGDGWTLPVIEHIFKFIKNESSN
jgi:DNA (cytosine-5)-methyltransferase 3A